MGMMLKIMARQPRMCTMNSFVTKNRGLSVA